jgi:hypothetical protein
MRGGSPFLRPYDLEGHHGNIQLKNGRIDWPSAGIIVHRPQGRSSQVLPHARTVKSVSKAPSLYMLLSHCELRLIAPYISPLL